MDFLLYVLFATTLLIVIAGIVVFLRNPKKSVNLYFLFTAISVGLWIFTNAIFRSISLQLAYYDALLSYGFALSAISFIGLFLYDVSNRLTNKIRNIYLCVGLSCSILSVVPGILATGLEDDYTIKTTVLSNVYGLLLLLLIGGGLVSLYRARRRASPGPERKMFTTILIGFLGAVIVGVTFNLIIPIIFGSYEFVQLGPLSGAVIVVTSGYAIVKHGLFDIRLIAARSLGYVLSLGSIGVIAIAVLFFLSGTLINFGVSNNVLRGFYVLVSIVLAVGYVPTKKFFDKITNQLFYKDAYESQDLLDELNKVLVGTIELEKLLTKASDVICSTLKVEFCVFGIREVGNAPQRIIGTTHKEFSEKDIEAVRSITPEVHTKIIVSDELERDDQVLQKLLRKNNVSVLGRLTDQPNKIAEGLGYIILGSKKSGYPYSRQDVKVLEIIADEMVIAIQNALRFEEIQNFAETLQEKVEEATRNLRKANEKLKKLDETKDDFISMASHQLRTPLTSVKGYVSMVLEGDAGKITNKQRELLDQAFVSSQRMVYLIADLLNVSRLRTGKFIIEAKPTNLADVVEGEINQLTETAKGRDLELKYSKPKEFPTLMLDETKIRQVIMNFADNAIYYTPSGGHIVVGLEDKGETVEFTVTDDGIGVPKEEQHHLFNKFYRAGNAKKARPDGTGLGLFMAKKVVVAQGGAIIFKTQEGKGSTFGFSFDKKALSPENYKGSPTTEVLAKDEAAVK